MWFRVARAAALCLVALGFAACGDADSDDETDAPQTTVAAPLRPELRQQAQGGVGRIEEWVETWNLVNAALQEQSADFPTIRLDVGDFTLRGGADGFPVFTGEIDGLILGGVVAAEDGGITSLLLVGQPTDPDFLGGYSIWLASLDPTVDPQVLLPVELAFGDLERSVVESNGRTYEAVKVEDSSGAGTAVSISMVPGLDVDDQLTLSAHRVVRRNVLSALTEETPEP